MRTTILFGLLLLALSSEAQKTNSFAGKTKTLTNAKPTFSYTAINGQLNSAQSTAPLMGILSITSPSWNVVKDKHTGLPIAIDGIKTQSSSLGFSPDRSETMINEVFSALKSALKLTVGRNEFRILQQETDAYGNYHIKFQQTKDGIDVYGAQAWLHFRANGEITYTGRTVPTPKTNVTQFTVSQSAAENIAKADLQKKYSFTDKSTQALKDLHLLPFETEKVVLTDENTLQSKLVWHISVRPDIMHHWEYFVDANSGAVVNKYNHTCAVGPTTANANDLKGVTQTINTFNANGTHYLIDASKPSPMFTGSFSSKPNPGDGIIITLDLQNTNLNNPSYVEITSAGNNSWSPTAVSAHNNSSLAFNYFKNKFTRNSIDGKGGDVVAFINVADENGGGLDNAFWNGQYMFYGNGASAFKPLARGLDVGGHEMTHGVVQNTAGLEYQGESGAINESMADCFGVLIEGLNYTIGEDVVKPAAYPSGALRNMQDPHNGGSSLGDAGYQPAHVNEQYTGSQDNGGVHINSGIPNKAFYLIATSISKSSAEQIYYKALSQYLTKSSKFIDLRIAVVKAATDIYGAGSNEVNVIKQSFDAVGIVDGTGGSYQNNIPQNPGSEKLLIVNTDSGDPNSLYLTTSAASSFQPLTTTPLNRKASVSDDGSYAYFVGTDHNIYAVLLTSPYTQTALTNDAFWDNVAVSKDGNKLAAVSRYIDTSIYIYKLGNASWGKFRLYTPTTAQGVAVGGALYADVLEWDYSGNNVLFDCYNEINGSGGQKLTYWDLGVMNVWSTSTNSYGDGTIAKLFNLDEGESLGNPTYAKNSPYIISFDYINNNTSQNFILGSNTETGDIGTIYDNGELGTPSYSPTDSKLAFSSSNASNVPVVGVIDLVGDKINGTASTAVAIINGAKWPTWFANGSRVLKVEEILTASNVSLFPNPALDKIFIDFESSKNTSVEIYNTIGEKMNIAYSSTDKSIDIASLAAGSYILNLRTEKGNVSKRFVKM
ncbi:MAG: M4 family metallopeptidase [Chitinophagales bacterium]|nr:M4 family metallopeptidase [Chitinophagales bacterium]